mgnify:CR=1 FL=1
MGEAQRWRVAIVDDRALARRELREAVQAAGGGVVGEAVRRAEAAALLARVRPDVLVVAARLPDGDGCAVAAEVGAQLPVVLLTDPGDESLLARAVQAGVMGWLARPVRRPEVAATLDLAIARHREIRELRRRLEERKLIERAKGLLMARYGLTEDEAFRRLRRTAMDRRESMATVARSLLVSESLLGDVPRA